MYNIFNTLVSILSGLNLGYVQWLKKTWEVGHIAVDWYWWTKALPNQFWVFCSLTELVNSSGNFKVYRKTIREVEPNLPVLPHLGIGCTCYWNELLIAVFLKDLTSSKMETKILEQMGWSTLKRWRCFATVFSGVKKYQVKIHLDLPYIDSVNQEFGHNFEEMPELNVILCQLDMVQADR